MIAVLSLILLQGLEVPKETASWPLLMLPQLFLMAEGISL